MTKDDPSSHPLREAILAAIDDKKGQDVVVLDLRDIPEAVCDFFVICSADSTTAVNAIAGGVEKDVKDALGVHPLNVEGRQNARWVVIDYFDIVVHVFHREARAFYQLEQLWSDAPTEQR